MRKFLAIASLLLVIGTIVQFYLAGLGVFSTTDDELFLVHGTNGRIVLPVIALAVLIGGVSSRLGKRIGWLSALPLILLICQTLLFIVVGGAFGLSSEHSVIPLPAALILALHAVNGLAIFYIGTMLVRRVWPIAFRGVPAPVRTKDAASAEPATTEV